MKSGETYVRSIGLVAPAEHSRSHFSSGKALVDFLHCVALTYASITHLNIIIMSKFKICIDL